MSEKRSELQRIAPFSDETLSEGSFWVFHSAFSASFVRIVKGLELGDAGILLVSKNLMKLSLMIVSLNYLLKGPTYETKEEASKTSPVMYSKSWVS